ncbi:MAG: hypothetical protein Q9160_009239 [Pyrenula sp. 1 TL-2023]
MPFKAFVIFYACLASVISSPDAASSLNVGRSIESTKSPFVNVTNVWTFPNGTWVENLAVRSNGQILATLLTSPQVYQIDPNNKTPTALVHTFHSFRGALGIIEQEPDIFYVVVGNGSFQIFPDTAGSFTIFRLDVSHFIPGQTPATVTKVANIPTSSYLNGVTVLGSSNGTLLIADSGAGAVYSLDTSTGATAKVSADPLFSPTNDPPTGINGIKVRQSTLYFTNAQQQVFGSVPVSPNGTFTGPVKIISTGLVGIDDFQFDPSGNGVYFAGNDQLRFQHAGNGSSGSSGAGQVMVASEDPLLEGSTAVAFGRGESMEGRSLYVSTKGPIAQYQQGNFTSPGRIVRVRLGGEMGIGDEVRRS